MGITELPAVQLLALLEEGTHSSRDITEEFLAVIARADPNIGAFVRSDADAALIQADKIDKMRTAGKPVGPLGGIPVAIKDVLCTVDEVTSCGSRMLHEYRPPYDATSVSRLKKAGAIVIGKTNMDEFAMGCSTENSAFHPTLNPWNPEYVPGGSSGGAAACVAASMAPLSVGSDTGGSIRQPASHCGVVGLKPTYGRVSRYGLIAFGSSLDCVGPIARNVEDLAILLEVLAGPDEKDATSVQADVPDYLAACREPLEELKLGVVQEHFSEGLDPTVKQCVDQAIGQFKALGATVTNVQMPHSQYAIAAYYIIASSEASSNLARYDGAHYGYRASPSDTQSSRDLMSMYRDTRQMGFGAEVKRRIMLGTYALSAGYYDAYYLKALRTRRLIAQDFSEAFKNVDLLIGPVAPTPAFRLGEKVLDPLAMYLSDSYTVAANLSGLPAISIPCGRTEAGLPIGFQLQGPALSESKLLRAGNVYQQNTDWHLQTPAAQRQS